MNALGKRHDGLDLTFLFGNIGWSVDRRTFFEMCLVRLLVVKM